MPDKAVTFERQTPRLYLPREERERLYERAFLEAEREDAGEYSRDTTTWD